MSEVARADTGSARSGLWSWLEGRTGIASAVAFMKSQARKPVPSGLSWLYTMGTLAAFFFSIQFVTGFLLLMYYVPQEGMAYESVEKIQHEVSLGWLIRQMHVWGSNFIVIVLLLHVVKVLWHGSYKRPREFTWFVGFLLLAVTLGFCLSGYLLPWNQLAYWGTRVAVATIDSIPYIGSTLKGWVCGSPDVSGSTIGRFFALHVIVLPAVLVALLGIHLALVTKHGIAPKTTTTEEKELGYYNALDRHGAEPFFPRQVYRELFVLNLGFALLVTVAYLWPLELGDPQSSQTPEHIKPEWYFLPVYQVLKYFDDDLYAALPFLQSWQDAYMISPAFLGFCVVNSILGLLFLLPLLDRSRQRAMRRRPFFAVFALVTALSIVVLGGLGYLSGKDVTFGGRTYRFTQKGYPELLVPALGADDRADHGEDGSRATGPDGERRLELRGGLGQGQQVGTEEGGAAPESRPDEAALVGDTVTGEAETDGAETDRTETDRTETDGTESADTESADTATETDDTEEREPDVASEAESGDQRAARPGVEVAAAGGAVAAMVKNFRTDGLANGGTCANPDCHDSAPQDDWLTSVHVRNQVECRQCHGGIDTTLPPISGDFREDLEGVLEPRAFAHLGVHLDRRGQVTAPPLREIGAICGRCHVEVFQVFSALHYDAPPEGQNRMTCVRCHSNHAVQPADETLYEKGYTDPEDPRTKPFLSARSSFARLEKRIADLRTGSLMELREKGLPVAQFDDALKIAEDDLIAKRHLVHALDEERVRAETTGLEEYLGAIESRLKERADELKGRWRFVAFAWAAVIVVNALIAMRLLSLPGPRRRARKAPARPSGAHPSTARVPPSDTGPPAILPVVPAEPPPVSSPSLAESLRIAALPDELFESEEEIDEEEARTEETSEPELAPPAVPLVDRLRIAALPDELFEIEEEEKESSSRQREISPADFLAEEERRALLDE